MTDDRPPTLVLESLDGWLHARVTGNLRLATLEGYIDQIAQAVRDRAASAALVDLSASEELIVILDRVRLGFRLGQVWPPQVPLAVLVAPAMHLPDRTFEHVSSQQGLPVRTFSDAAKAQAWLALKTRHGPEPGSHE